MKPVGFCSSVISPLLEWSCENKTSALSQIQFLYKYF
jgi:hypothetical protein